MSECRFQKSSEIEKVNTYRSYPYPSVTFSALKKFAKEIDGILKNIGLLP